MFGSRKRTSSNVAKERLKLVLVYDRAGTSSNNDMIDMMKRDIMRVISEYVEIDESQFEIDIKTSTNQDYGMTSELVANIPIRRIRKLGRNRA